MGKSQRSRRCWTAPRVGHTPLLQLFWDLRENRTAYDVAYVALAEALDAPLLTGDQRIAMATGPRCAIEVLKVGRGTVGSAP